MTADTQAQGDLAPCPFCGKSVGVVSTFAEMTEYEDGFDDGSAPSYAVFCDAHKPNGPGGCGASSGFMPTEEEAVARWNARAAALQGRGTQEGEPSDAVEDAMAGYLRVCSCGGMPKKQIDLIKRHISEAKRLGYFDRAALAQADASQAGERTC